MPNPLDLERVRDYCAKATAGPWVAAPVKGYSGMAIPVVAEVEVDHGSDIVAWVQRPIGNHLCNAVFIEQSRTDLPAAVEEIAELRAEVAAANATLEWCYKYGMVRTLGSGMDDFDYHPIDRETLEKAYRPRNEQERK